MSLPQMNHKLVLEAPIRTPDGAGGYATTWQPLGTLWAEVKAGSGREAAGAETSLSRVAYRITVRAAPFGSPSRPLPEQRFRDGDRLFSIQAVTEADPGARHLTCHAQEERVT